MFPTHRNPDVIDAEAEAGHDWLLAGATFWPLDPENRFYQ
jgi:hypothetical protein